MSHQYKYLRPKQDVKRQEREVFIWSTTPWPQSWTVITPNSKETCLRLVVMQSTICLITTKNIIYTVWKLEMNTSLVTTSTVWNTYVITITASQSPVHSLIYLTRPEESGFFIFLWTFLSISEIIISR